MHFTAIFTTLLASSATLCTAKDTWNVFGYPAVNGTACSGTQIAKEHGDSAENNCRKTDNRIPAPCFTAKTTAQQYKFNLRLFADDGCVNQTSSGVFSVAGSTYQGGLWKSFRIDNAPAPKE